MRKLLFFAALNELRGLICASLMALTLCHSEQAHGQNSPLSGLAPRGQPQASDLIPIMPAGGTQLMQTTVGAIVSPATAGTVGTVQGVNLSIPGFNCVVTGTTTLTVTCTANAESANTFYAGPTSGSSSSPTFRAITIADLCGGTLNGASSSTYLRGDCTWQTPGGGGGGSGTVTSVGLSLPGIFSVSGSPVTSSGTLTGALASETANYFFAAPNGANGAPAFRGMVIPDLPLSGVAVGTYVNATVTVDAEGLVTSASNGVPGEIEYPGAQCSAVPTTSVFSANANVGSLTISNVTQGVQLSGAPTAHNLSIWYFTAPTPPFSIYLRQVSSFLYDSYGIDGGAGIGLYNGSGNVVALILNNQIYAPSGTVDWWTTLSNNPAGGWTSAGGTSGWPWLRMDVTSTTWTAYVSVDGHQWTPLYGPHNISDQPTSITAVGLAVDNNYNGGTDLIQCFSQTPPS